MTLTALFELQRVIGLVVLNMMLQVTDIVRLLLIAGADASIQNEYPLQLAHESNNITIVKLIEEHKRKIACFAV